MHETDIQEKKLTIQVFPLEKICSIQTREVREKDARAPVNLLQLLKKTTQVGLSFSFLLRCSSSLMSFSFRVFRFSGYPFIRVYHAALLFIFAF